MIAEVIALVLLILGGGFFFIGALGITRFPDVYFRLQCSSKSLTFGFCFIVMAAGIWDGTSTGLAKAGLAVLFQFVTAPISAYVMGRAAIARGIRPYVTARTKEVAGSGEVLRPLTDLPPTSSEPQPE